MIALLQVAAAGCEGDRVREGFARGAGRLEAEQIHTATRFPGRVIEVLVDEGDDVEEGQVLARMDAGPLKAELERARARVAEVREQRDAAEAIVAQRKSETELAETEYQRALALREERVVSQSRVDHERTRLETARAAREAAEARLRDAAEAIEVARAAAARVREDLDETLLRAPRSGRVQYRLAEPGEVLPAGGRVLTLLDLDDVTLTFFLPTAEAGRARVGAEARVVLDAHPENPLPARVSFVASEAQFTPKEVETESERRKLSFRVEVRIDGARGVPLNAGTPGVAWIRLDEAAPWPEPLR
jgi:HlyD family secretion protein